MAATFTSNHDETALIADQLRRIHKGPAWLGPSLEELLSEVDEAKAARRPLPNAHTIWELVLHITAWLRIGRERLSASETRDHTEAENWPPMTGTWFETQARLALEAAALEEAILDFAPGRLNERAPATEPQTFYVLLHGIVQHSAYHAGQIAVLAK